MSTDVVAVVTIVFVFYLGVLALRGIFHSCPPAPACQVCRASERTDARVDNARRDHTTALESEIVDLRTDRDRLQKLLAEALQPGIVGRTQPKPLATKEAEDKKPTDLGPPEYDPMPPL